MNPKRPTLKHIIIKMPKFKDKENHKSSKRKVVSYLQRSSINLSTDFSTKTLQAIKEWYKRFKVVEREDYKQDYLARLSLKSKKR